MKKTYIFASLLSLLGTSLAAQAAEEGAASSTTVSTPSSALSSSTSSVLPAPTADRVWSLTFENETSMTATELNHSKNDRSFETSNFAGVGYKTNPRDQWGLRQYFSMNRDAEKGKNSTQLQDTVLTFSRSDVAGVLNSEKLTPEVRYYLPTSETSRQNRSYGVLRSDVEVGWNLTPKWTASYYLSPRQGFTPEGEVVDGEGKRSPLFAKTKLIHYGCLYHHFSDSITAYTYGGFLHQWKTRAATLIDEETHLGLGASFSLIGGKISLNPEIAVASARLKDGAKVAVGQLIQEKNVSYVMTSSFVF